LAKCSATALPIRLRSTPRSMSTVSGRSPKPGQPWEMERERTP
jgi:hypothetical protein